MTHPRKPKSEPRPTSRPKHRAVIGRPSARFARTTSTDPLVRQLADRLAKSLSGFSPEYTTTNPPQ